MKHDVLTNEIDFYSSAPFKRTNQVAAIASIDCVCVSGSISLDQSIIAILAEIRRALFLFSMSFIKAPL